MDTCRRSGPSACTGISSMSSGCSSSQSFTFGLCSDDDATISYFGLDIEQGSVGVKWDCNGHVRPLCSAATASQLVNALQTCSLLLLGTIFWRQILAPREDERLSPPGAVLYLFSACVACSILGILITFAPVSVCPIYAQPRADNSGIAKLIQVNWGFTAEKDQQIGGLLMWVPMCFVYLTAIIAQLARWFAHPIASTPVTDKAL